jgi:amidase
MSGSRQPADLHPPERSLRVALSTRAPAVGVRADRELRLAVEATADALRGAGHVVIVTDPPYPVSLTFAFIHRFFAGIARECDELGYPVERLEKRTQTLVRIGRYLNRRRQVPAAGADAWTERFTTWFRDFDVLLTPTTARPSIPAGGWLGKGWIRTLNAGTQQVPFTQAWNVAGFPAASVPAGIGTDGVPLGAQLVAPRGGEPLLLSVAAQLEELRPWPRHAPLAGVATPVAVPA